MAQAQLRVGSWYWERLKEESESRGVVVMCAWMLSKRRSLAHYTRLYGSCGWDTLVCQPQMFNLFFPNRSLPLAHALLVELAQEIEKKPRPIVFAAFSGGHRGCLHNILEMLQGKGVMRFNLVTGDKLRRCIVGQIYDSTPVDFVTEMGAIFVSHQVLTFKPGHPIAFVDFICQVVAKVLDMILHRQLEPARAALWSTFYSSAIMGPILIFGSDDDELSPVVTMHKCRSHILDLGGNAEVISWKKSEHVGHLRLHPEEYKPAVKRLLADAATLYVRRSENIQNAEISKWKTTAGVMNGPLTQGSQKPVPDLALLASTDAVCSPLPENLAMEVLRLSNLPHIRGLKQSTMRSGFLTPRLIILIFVIFCLIWYLTVIV